MREVCRLVSYGVPWDVAWRMSPARRLGFIVAFGENAGGQWDWAALRWKDQGAP